MIAISDNVMISEKRSKIGDVVYSVPYSEHSSFPELIDFVRVFKPIQVVPTVKTNQKDVQKQLQLLRDGSGVYPNNKTAVSETCDSSQIEVSTQVMREYDRFVAKTVSDSIISERRGSLVPHETSAKRPRRSVFG